MAEQQCKVFADEVSKVADMMENSDTLGKMKIARAVMGDEWVKENITNGIEPSEVQEELAKKQKQGREALRKMAFS